MNAPSFGDMFRVFGRIGLLSFGGPAAQIALMHKELVEDRSLLDEQTFLRALSLCMVLPGPEAMQLATYAGWRLRGLTGGLLAGLLFVLPGALIIAVLVALYASFGQIPLVQAAFTGVKAAVIVVVLQALLKLSRKALTGRLAWVLAGLAFVAIFVFDLPFPLIILVAAILGARFGPVQQAQQPAAMVAGAHRTAIKTAAIWSTLWLTPLVMLSLSGATVLADIGWFFARLAVVTFGGAYAVLAYMTQVVVDQYHWISTAQMIDALGLAETTPGPLILVTQFVAMLTGALQGGPTLAIAAGVVALWATFVPCFLWIFLAGPYLDQIAARPRLAAALQGISAAVVGVILNLSVWFALHVLFDEIGPARWSGFSFPWPEINSLNLLAVALTAVAGLLMIRFKVSLPTTLGLMAVIGAATHFA